jgi:hypothetical protein
MVREGTPTTSLFASAKDVDAERSLCPGLDPGIGMTGSAAGESDSAAAGIKSIKVMGERAKPGHDATKISLPEANLTPMGRMPTASILFASAKEVDANRSLVPGLTRISN